MRAIRAITSTPEGHWVGDGFPVRSLFSYHDLGAEASPFLLFDYAGPYEFTPAKAPRGVGDHPHRGFETVTIVYDGEVEHRDSSGGGGKIGPGDVQWMTAAAGIVHREFHSKAFTEKGGPFEMVQLWVNLPAKDKSARAGYQTVRDATIPSVALPGEAGRVRVIAGDYLGHKGPARTFTPIELWDIRLRGGKSARFVVPEGRNLLLAALSGVVEVNGAEILRPGQVAAFARAGGEITVEANVEAKLLLLSGAPIDEPIAGQGPFVMNTADELRQAFADYRAGKFGAIAA